MNGQHEINKPTPLLDEYGALKEPGYCKRNLFVYDRSAVTAPSWRLKEWDFYQISDGKFMVQVNFADISIGAAATADALDFSSGRKISSAKAVLFPRKRLLPLNGDVEHRFGFSKGKTELLFDVTERERRICFSDGKLEIDVTALRDPDAESITIATPFKKRNRFFYTNKINCMPARGFVKYCGETVKEFREEDTFAVLDWGRGVWPYSNYWYWASGSARLEDGKLFGFEITFGIGDESHATETMLFYDGKAHKIGAVNVETPPDGRWMQPWHFISEDGRLDLTMTPFYDNCNPFNLGVVKFSCHQVHGLWSGRAVLDDGKIVEVRDMYAFAEKMYNRW